MIERFLDAVVVDIGGTIVTEHPPGTPVQYLVPQLLTDVESDLLALSRAVRLAAATNTAVMSESDVRALLAQVNIDGYFEVIVTSHDVGAPKPDPAVLLVAMRRLGLTIPSRILYIGDRATDQQAAIAAGMGFTFTDNAGLLRSVEMWLAEQSAPNHAKSSASPVESCEGDAG
jgi:HAD superfamily hydrolase (TIGR01509 family)